MYNFPGLQQGNGIVLTGAGANRVEGNHLGTDAAGTTDRGNRGSGLRIAGGDGDVVGGTTPGARNVISGNDFGGVRIESGDNHVVSGN